MPEKCKRRGFAAQDSPIAPGRRDPPAALFSVAPHAFDSWPEDHLIGLMAGLTGANRKERRLGISVFIQACAGDQEPILRGLPEEKAKGGYEASLAVGSGAAECGQMMIDSAFRLWEYLFKTNS